MSDFLTNPVFDTSFLDSAVNADLGGQFIRRGGKSVAEIQKAHDEGKIAVTDLEVQGVAEYKAISKHKVIAVFVLPPNYVEWQRRLKARYGSNGVDTVDMQKRMKTAITELEEALSKDYYHYVVNEDLGQAVKAVNSIAHHHDEFTIIDRSFQVWAERLLEDLHKGVKTQKSK